MNSLKSESLLLIVPHFRVFIKDQASLIRPYFSNMIVLIPLPYFSNLALNLPYLKRYFGFLKLAEESCNELAQDYIMIPSKFFTLPIKELQKRNSYLASASSIKALSKNAINFDLIHTHFLNNGFIGAKLKNLYNKPLVVTAHGGDVYDLPFRNNWYNTLARYVLNEADQVITVSRFNAEKIKSLGISSKKIHVVPNGYDEKLFKPMPQFDAQKKLRLPHDKKLLLSVGNLVDTKGHTYLIDAMNFVTKKQPNVILVILGSGPLNERLQKKVNKYGLKEKILLAGRKPHEEIPIWMNACDLFILPSLDEGFPTVIPEALACGKPVIGTCVGGIPEIISKDKFGMLVKPKDAVTLAEAILKSINRKWDSEDILKYAEQYSWTRLVKQILKVYETALM